MATNSAINTKRSPPGDNSPLPNPTEAKTFSPSSFANTANLTLADFLEAMPPYRNKTVGATLIVAAMLLAVQPVLVTGRDSRPYPAMADVPACARDVFLPLHRDKDHDNATSMCQGLLIRDNILLTSNECSKHNSVFRLPGVGFFQATPPRNKMKVANLDPRLGFLHTNVPYHKQSRDHRVQRNRVFLSLQSTDDNGTAMSMSCCMSTNGSHRPVAHNFPVDGEQVSLGHLHKAMPYVLWEHTDILTAPELVDGKQRWWTRYITLEEETKSMQAQIKKYNNGPPGSLSVWPEFYTEVLDPGGHRMEPCIQNYHQRYREEMPFSGESFFDWLDYGSGRHVMTRGYKKDGMKHFKHMDSDDECSKENLDRYKIHYFNDKERLAFEVHITRSDHGNHLIARYKQSGVLVPKSTCVFIYLFKECPSSPLRFLFIESRIYCRNHHRANWRALTTSSNGLSEQLILC